MADEKGAGEGEEAERLHREGNELVKRGDRVGAEAAYRAALAVDPARPSTLNNLANLRRDAGDLDGAWALYERAYGLGGRSAALLAGAAKTALDREDVEAAALRAREAVALHPDREAGHLVLVKVLTRTSPAGARAAIERGLEALPSSGALWNELGRLEDLSGDLRGAVAAYARASALLPTSAVVLANFGDAVRRTKDLDRALELLQRALELDPNHAPASASLSALFIEAGRCEDAARVAFDGAARTQGLEARTLESLRLFALCHTDTIEPAALFEEHARWGCAVEADFPPSTADVRRRRGARDRTRVVYLSSDFRDHVVARFLAPVLAAHDESRFEILLAATHERGDAVTEELRRKYRMVELGGLPRQTMRRRLVELDADVVVELAGHSGDALPLPTVLVPRVAPLQITWLGYPGTTGLSVVDVRITDALIDPPGAERDYTERLARLDRPPWVYLPASMPDVRARTGGRPTFGCFNRGTKITGATVDLFARTLAAVPDARLVLRPLLDGSAKARARLLDAFAQRGVGERVVLTAVTPTYEEALADYAQVDVALDTFPYHGTTTTCDALVMGVPVVSRVGPWPAARVAASLANAVGLDDLVTRSADDYVRTAAALVRDSPRLDALRGELRRRVERGPLGDAEGLARALEAVFVGSASYST